MASIESRLRNGIITQAQRDPPALAIFCSGETLTLIARELATMRQSVNDPQLKGIPSEFMGLPIYTDPTMSPMEFDIISDRVVLHARLKKVPSNAS